MTWLNKPFFYNTASFAGMLALYAFSFFAFGDLGAVTTGVNVVIITSILSIQQIEDVYVFYTITTFATAGLVMGITSLLITTGHNTSSLWTVGVSMLTAIVCLVRAMKILKRKLRESGVWPYAYIF